MSSLLSAELAATCNALGYYNVQENKYYADANTLETVKDLIRYLRKDDENHDIRRHLGETKVVQTDLLPLMKSYWEETELFDVLLRLLVNLTMPALILWHEEPPTEKTTRNYYLQIETHLQDYKQAFADEGVWAVLSTRISKILEIDCAERGDENGLIIERILILIRNILYIPIDPDAERRPDNDASIHDQVLWSLHQSGMLDIILYIASSTMEQAYYMHILEILSFMLREQNPSELANAALQRSQTEKLRDEAQLLAIRHRENGQRQQKLKMYNGTRHSRFGGTYVVKSMKSISDNELIYHKPLSKLESLDFDVDKQRVKTPKNRLPLQGSSTERRSAFSIRLFLKEFCIEFLNGAYNTLMCQIKRNLVRVKSQNHDESYYLWAMRFFMEFNRSYKFEVKLVSETMSVQTFHYVQQQMEHHFDMINQDKKKMRLWSRRLHLALLAYRELLFTICVMDKSPIDAVKHSAKVIKSNIFYVLEYRELVLTLLVTFDELKMSPVYLNDLIECQHIFLKMLQTYCDGGNTQIVVQGKARAKKKSRKRQVERPPDSDEAAGNAGTDLEGRWDEMAPQLSVILEGGGADISSNVVPFDATSEVPIDDQKSEAMKNVQRKLRSGDYEEAVGLLRAAREVWPENDCFGSSNMAPQEEFLALRDIFFADLGVQIEAQTEPDRIESENPNDYLDEENEEEYEDEQLPESDLKFQDFAKRLAHPKVVRACGLALRNFDRNPVTTNHCIVKLLHRIAWDCKMAAMLFQASIFRTFQKIYDLKDAPQFKELVKFANYIVREFVSVAEKNPKVYVEALFWKSSRDAFDVAEGYGSYHEKSAAAAKAWTELEEDELRRLFMEHQEKQITEDVVDWVLNNLIDNSARTRRGVLKKLKEMYLLTEYKGRKASAGNNARPPKHWSTDEEAQLRELYEQFKDANDPLGCIVDRLDVHRPKNRIVEKLLVMGLVQDRKELRKKRGKSRNNAGAQSNEDDSMASDLEEDDDTTEVRSNFATNTQRTGKQTKKGPRQKQNSKKSQKKNKPKHIRASKSELTKLLLNVVSTGSMSEALEWIKESFSDAAEDMEDDTDTDETGIPLVPILDCSVTAMEDPQFQKLLLAFGVAKPADEQESYWRIPFNLNQAILNDHCELITKALEGTLQLEEDDHTNDDDASGVGSAVVDDQTRGESSSDDDEYVFGNLKKLGTSQNRDEVPNPIEEPSTSTQKSNAPRRRKLVALEDSESDQEKEILEVDEVENVESGKRSRLSDSDSEKPMQKRSKRITILDSDEED